MRLAHDLLVRLRQTVLAYAGDATLTQAGLSAAANVIVADGEISAEEFETALAGVLANPIVRKGYDHLMLEDELYAAVGRARTRAGRVENLRRVSALAQRPVEQRQDAFLIAADVADHDGISAIEYRAPCRSTRRRCCRWRGSGPHRGRRRLERETGAFRRRGIVSQSISTERSKLDGNRSTGKSLTIHEARDAPGWSGRWVGNS